MAVSKIPNLPNLSQVKHWKNSPGTTWSTALHQKGGSRTPENQMFGE